MPDNSLSPAERTVLVFCETIAFALGWNGVDRLLAGGSSLVVIPILLASISFSYIGFKWPQIKPKISATVTTSVEQIASNILYRRAIYSLMVLALVASIGFSIYRHYHNLSIPSAASSAIPKPSQAGEHTVKVIDENGGPLKGAEIYFIRRNGVHSIKAVSEDTGSAEVATLSELVSVFCARDGFSSYYQKDYDPSTPLKIRLKKNPHGGSVIFADGTGYITGLSGRLNPILDMLGRTYLYAGNIAIDGGKTQPVPFVLNVPMTLEDVDGHRVEIKIVSIIGSSSLIDYRRLS